MIAASVFFLLFALADRTTRKRQWKCEGIMFDALTVGSGNFCCFIWLVHPDDGGIVNVWMFEQKILQFCDRQLKSNAGQLVENHPQEAPGLTYHVNQHP